MHDRPPYTAWLASLVVLAFGFCTGLQLAKVAPYVDRLGSELGLGLTYAGWLTSVLALFVALGAVPAGALVARMDVLAWLKASAVVMVAGAVLFGLLADPAALLAARVVEAAGYVFAVIAAPAYLAMAAPDRFKAVFLALWGSVVPVGFALANLLAGSLPVDIALSSAFLWFAVPLAVIAVPVMLIRGKPAIRGAAEPASTPSSRTEPIAWILVIGFGMYVYLSIGFFTFLPTYAAAHPGPGLSPGAVALVVPVGSLATALILARWRRLSVLGLAATGLVAMAVTGAMVFTAGWGGAVAQPVYAFASGVSASCFFAAVPVFARSRRSATRTIGAIAQAGGIATLAAPPVAGWVIEHLGWPALAISFVAVAAVVGAATVISMRARQTVVGCA